MTHFHVSMSFPVSCTNLLSSNSAVLNMAAFIADFIFLALALLLVNYNDLAVCEDQEVWRSTGMAKNACDQEAEYQTTGKFLEPKKDYQDSKYCGWFSKGIPRGDACADIRMHFTSCKDLIIGSEASVRVVNGTKPRKYVFKSLANFGSCTGSLIHNNFVMTAGHCTVPGAVNYPTHVQLAAYEKGKPDPHQQNLRIYEKITHENYNPDSIYENDVGLVRIASATFNEFVQPATLPPSRDFVAMGPAYFIGYGLTEDPNPGGDLREITLPIIPNKKCEKVFDNVSLGEHLVCAGYDRKQMGLCNGDSGGPLYVCRNYRLVQVGILSGGKPPCGEGPALFNKVSRYLDWISSKIEKQKGSSPPANPPSNETIR